MGGYKGEVEAPEIIGSSKAPGRGASPAPPADDGGVAMMGEGPGETISGKTTEKERERAQWMGGPARGGGAGERPGLRDGRRVEPGHGAAGP